HGASLAACRCTGPLPAPAWRHCAVMDLLGGVTVRAGRGVAEAHAARVLGALGAQPAPGDDGAVGVTAPGASATVRLSGAGGDADSAERRLQADWGLAALTGEADGPPTLLGGRPMLHHAGGGAGVAGML